MISILNEIKYTIGNVKPFRILNIERNDNPNKSELKSNYSVMNCSIMHAAADNLGLCHNDVMFTIYLYKLS